MNASVHRIAHKAFHHINTTWITHSISNSIRVPIPRSHLGHQSQLSKAFYTRFLRPKETEFCYASVRRFSSNTNGTTTRMASITNSGPIGWYLGMIKARPILTKSITSALIFTAADITSQTMTRSSSEAYDFIRTCRMAGYGMILLGPILHFWFNLVSRVLPKQDLVTTLKKMFVGQTILGPIMNALFFSVNAALQGITFEQIQYSVSGGGDLLSFDDCGENGEEIVARLKRDMLPTMINNAIYWPLCDFITFRFVPVHLQPLVNNSFAYVWTIYITYMANLAKAGTDESNTKSIVE